MSEETKANEIERIAKELRDKVVNRLQDWEFDIGPGPNNDLLDIITKQLCAAQVKQPNSELIEHRKHVGEFLSELYAIMVDPLGEGTIPVKEMCDTLLKRAREDRELLQVKQPQPTSDWLCPICGRESLNTEGVCQNINCKQFHIKFSASPGNDVAVGPSVNEETSAEGEQPAQPAVPNINVPLNQRERDLLRYCRQELHQANLITDDEFVEMLGWGSNGPGGGSPSARRLEDYDELRAKLDAALQSALSTQPQAGAIQETPTLELERVAVEAAKSIADNVAFIPPMPVRFNESKCARIILSALKQVQPKQKISDNSEPQGELANEDEGRDAQ